MSHGKLRADKTCLNCGHTVEDRFCGHCGQENTEVRQPFYSLFTHFLEDFTHYDGQFWRTIRYLIFVPGKLTNEYLAGKRQQYVAPVKLYIFISFIVFFIPTLFPSQSDHAHKEEKALKREEVSGLSSKDSLLFHQKIKGSSLSREEAAELLLLFDSAYVGKVGLRATKKEDKDVNISIDSNAARNRAEYDSLAAHSESRFYQIMKPFAHRVYELKSKGYDGDEIIEKFKESFTHVFPKALFIYLPIFAFALWLFHSKKRWWYFDHGIFTLHFFSFLLLASLSIIVVDQLNDWINKDFFDTFASWYNFITILFMMAYFFISHRRVYQYSKRSTILRGVFLFIINLFIMLFLMIGLALFSFMTLH